MCHDWLRLTKKWEWLAVSGRVYQLSKWWRFTGDPAIQWYISCTIESLLSSRCFCPQNRDTNCSPCTQDGYFTGMQPDWSSHRPTIDTIVVSDLHHNYFTAMGSHSHVSPPIHYSAWSNTSQLHITTHTLSPHWERDCSVTLQTTDDQSYVCLTANQRR